MIYKIKIFGWQHLQLDQVSRIKQGFLGLGHEIVDNNEDFIYCHDSSQYDNAINYHLQNNKKSKLLLKVLDLGIHCGNKIDEIKNKLCIADIILANSVTVQNQIKDYLNLESFVVYDAMKETYRIENCEKKFDFLAIGRLRDYYKRFYLMEELLDSSKNQNRNLVCCGPECPLINNKNIQWFGIVSNEVLNKLYNYARITLMFGSHEGVGLQIPESLNVGTPVICLNDNETSYEFSPLEFICEPNISSINEKVKEIESNYEYYQNLALNYGKSIAKKFDKVEVCGRIIQAFELVKKNNYETLL